jgi:peptidoglycan/LPS O-acetylase OafA/YrhL
LEGIRGIGAVLVVFSHCNGPLIDKNHSLYANFGDDADGWMFFCGVTMVQ